MRRADPLLDDVGSSVPRDRRADVVGIARTRVPSGNTIGLGSVEDQMFLAVPDGSGIRRRRAAYTGARLVGGDGLVTEVEAEPARSRMAHDPGQEEGGRE